MTIRVCEGPTYAKETDNECSRVAFYKPRKSSHSTRSYPTNVLKDISCADHQSDAPVYAHEWVDHLTYNRITELLTGKPAA